MTTAEASAAALSCLAFLTAFSLAGVVPAASRAMATASTASQALRSPGHDDDAKERLARQASLAMARVALSILGRTLCALLAPALVLLIFDRLGLASFHAVLTVMSHWQVLLAMTIIAVVAAYVRR